jgi:hypothetical protein
MLTIARRIAGQIAMVMLAGTQVSPATAQNDAVRSRANLIRVEDFRAGPAHLDRASTLLDIVRKQLPLVVQSGRFETDAGIAYVCVYARRGRARGLDAGSASRFPKRCPMIAAFVDGVRLNDAASYLESTRLLDLESVELVRASEAGWRYGFAADGADALVIWTRGRGPHARSPG